MRGSKGQGWTSLQCPWVVLVLGESVSGQNSPTPCVYCTWGIAALLLHAKLRQGAWGGLFPLLMVVWAPAVGEGRGFTHCSEGLRYHSCVLIPRAMPPAARRISDRSKSMEPLSAGELTRDLSAAPLPGTYPQPANTTRGLSPN